MSKPYTEAFVTAIIASFMARDGKFSIDHKRASEFLAMQGEQLTPSAIEHKTRDMKNKAKKLIANEGSSNSATSTPTKAAAPRKKRSAAAVHKEHAPVKKQKTVMKKEQMSDDDDNNNEEGLYAPYNEEDNADFLRHGI